NPFWKRCEEAMHRTLLATLLASSLTTATHAATWLVCPNGSADKACQFRGDAGIQQAVDKADNGDTIHLRAGTYTPRAYRDVPYADLQVRGYVVINNKTLQIEGEPGTVLDGAGGAKSSAFVVKGGNVGFSHLTLRNFDVLEPEDNIYDGHG